MPSWFVMLTQVLGIGSASGSRTALAVLVIALLGRADYAPISEDLSFLTSTPMLGALLAAAVVEELVERDERAQRLLAIINYGVRGAGGAFVSYVLIAGAKLPFDGWPIALIGAAFALATHGVRMKLYRLLRTITAGLKSPRRWLAWLEAGGVLGVVTAVVLAPFIACAFVALAAIGSAVLWGLSHAWEQGFRRPCPRCGANARREARLCRHCHTALPVTKVIGQDLLEGFDAHSTAGAPIRR